ncbi:MAG: hypothetical protein M4579_001537 [Chaenotheca gracillima]|nr:MAG: hypothetical protein M4579_001537 [Chaenotheca gracillima]
MANQRNGVEKPLNREPDLKKLTASFYTEEGAYDRNHGPIPKIDVESHVVQVDGTVKTPLSLSIRQLQNDFPQHSIVCALQCAGNRRHTMRTLLKEVQGIDWGDGAVMNCQWRGPRLRDVLNKAGLSLSKADRKRAHIAFACFATPCQEDTWFGASIELERGMREDGDVILALEMNHHPLHPNHGFPVRVVAPGIAGARSVKWLDRITVQLTESSNFYQQHDYKVLPPEAVDVEAAKRYWHLVPAVQDMPVNSVVAVPQTGDTVTLSKAGTVEAKGYALPGGDKGPVTRVEVSGDGGRTWTEAEVVYAPTTAGSPTPNNKWAWALWRAEIKLELCPPDKHKRYKVGRILSRATDTGGNKQCVCPAWNLRGVLYNGYGEARDLKVI